MRLFECFEQHALVLVAKAAHGCDQRDSAGGDSRLEVEKGLQR
jgi:hypothetical protein